MRVVVEITSGPATGRKIVLGARQTIQVGRTEWADFALPYDQRMSSVHFRLETDNAACYVEDLGSTNGTFIGGTRLQGRSRLRNQDELLAGDTQFVVRVEGDLAAEAARRAAMSPELDLPPPSVILESRPAPRSLVNVHYTSEKCDSGLTLCRGSINEIEPAGLAVRLCRLLPIYLIADFKHLENPPTAEDLTDPAYLFDWLDPAAAAVVSPVILSQEDLLTWPKLLEQGWGNDAVICLFSKQEKSVLVEHLRRACHAKANAADLNTAILGYCWPSVLVSLLSHHTPNFVQQLLTGIDAVLVEMPDLPETWQVFGTGQIVDLLDQIGFRPSTAESAISHA
jgi:hypothetical protein